MSQTLTRALVTITGEIDIATCEAMRDALTAGLGGGPVDLVADLSGVTFMDASGIGVLLGVRKQVMEAGGSFTLRAPSRAVRKVIGICGLDAVLPAIT